MRFYNPGVPPDPKFGYPKRPKSADGTPYVVVPSGYHNAGQVVPAPDGAAILAMVGEAFYVIPPKSWGTVADVAFGDENTERRIAAVKGMCPHLLTEEEFAEAQASPPDPKPEKVAPPNAGGARK